MPGTPDLLALIRSGALPVGSKLYHQPRRYPERGVTAKVVADGILLAGVVYSTPSAAAKSITGKPVDGWAFWRLKNGDQLDSLRPGSRRLV